MTGALAGGGSGLGRFVVRQVSHGAGGRPLLASRMFSRGQPGLTWVPLARTFGWTNEARH